MEKERADALEMAAKAPEERKAQKKDAQVAFCLKSGDNLLYFAQ